MSNATLEAMNLTLSRGNHTLFANLSFYLSTHELLCIEGPNGSGKSSLLRLLTGLSTPSSGEILWQGTHIMDIHTDYKAHFHYIGHANGIKLGLTVAENIQLMGHLEIGQTPKNVESALTVLQLKAHQNKLAKELSAGQRRRLALAKLLLFEKPLWILDEPLTALDAPTQDLFMQWLHDHLEKGGIGIICSHHLMHVKNATVQRLKLPS